MNYKRIIHLKEKLLADIQRQWTLQEMADEVNLSASHLRKHFRTITGLSPRQFLRHERLKAARNLLETTHLRVKEIRFEVGMNDPAHFTQAFKEMYGSAPSQYRSVFLANSTEKDVSAEK